MLGLANELINIIRRPYTNMQHYANSSAFNVKIKSKTTPIDVSGSGYIHGVYFYGDKNAVLYFKMYVDDELVTEIRITNTPYYMYSFEDMVPVPVKDNTTTTDANFKTYLIPFYTNPVDTNGVGGYPYFSGGAFTGNPIAGIKMPIRFNESFRIEFDNIDQYITSNTGRLYNVFYSLDE